MPQGVFIERCHAIQRPYVTLSVTAELAAPDVTTDEVTQPATYCCASSSATAMQPPAASLMRSTASARKQGAMSVTHGSALASSAPSCLQRSRRVRMMDTCVPPSQHACVPMSRPPCFAHRGRR